MLFLRNLGRIPINWRCTIALLLWYFSCTLIPNTSSTWKLRYSSLYSATVSDDHHNSRVRRKHLHVLTYLHRRANGLYAFNIKFVFRNSKPRHHSKTKSPKWVFRTGSYGNARINNEQNCGIRWEIVSGVARPGS